MKCHHQRVLLAAATFLFLSSTAVHATEVDDRIEAAAKNSYVFKHYLKDDSVNVDANEGVVTLKGSVSDMNHKSLAEKTVESLPGVTKVDNMLEVQGEPSTEGSDTWLALKVKTALLFHSKVNPMTTHVNVENGVVTLTGEVENQARKDLATEYAKDVDGVKDVKNDMVIKADNDHDKMRDAQDHADHKMRDVNDDVRDDVREVKSEAREAQDDARDMKADAMRHHHDDNDYDDMVDDASITAQAKMALLMHRSTSALSTKVDTNNGVVTLTGKAKSQAERELATKVVSDLRGVKNVVNNMDVVGDK